MGYGIYPYFTMHSVLRYSFVFIPFSHKIGMNPDPMGLLHQPMPKDLIPMP